MTSILFTANQSITFVKWKKKEWVREDCEHVKDNIFLSEEWIHGEAEDRMPQNILTAIHQKHWYHHATSIYHVLQFDP